MSINLAELPSGLVSYYQKDTYLPQLQVLPRPEPLNLFLYLPSSPQRIRVETFISEQFYLKHNARIKHYMPYLLSLENSGRKVLSAAGFRTACDQTLFLENYLDEPVEAILSDRLGENIDRNSIIEVGNLGSGSPGTSRLMIMAMTYLFNQQGFEWVVMTGTNDLLNIFRNMDLEPMLLARAEVHRLKDEQYDWGTYYSRSPYVMTGNVKYGNRRLLKTVSYRNFINSLCGFNLPPCPKHA